MSRSRKTFLWLLGALALLTAPVGAQFVQHGAPGIATQSTITDDVVTQIGVPVPSLNPNHSAAGRVPLPVNTSVKTLWILPVGDSISTDALPTPYNPASANVLNLSIYGGVYQAIDPLLGTPGIGGNYSTSIAQQAVLSGKWAQAVVAPVGINGATSFDFSPAGVLHQRARSLCWNIRGAGWIGNPNFDFAFIYSPGVNDTTAGTTYQQWIDNFKSWHVAMVAYGCDFPVFVNKQTRLIGVVNVAIQSAQAAVLGDKVLPGIDMDSITLNPANTLPDRTHDNDNGGMLAAVSGYAIISGYFR
jgi:lysophospholipase L1-like esterase